MTIEVVRKLRYWSALDHAEVFKSLGGFTLKALDGLKHIQDAVTLHRLIALKDQRILEVGGGTSRVLPALHDSNERWNLEPFEGAGNGVTTAVDMPGVKRVPSYLGDFDKALPDGYFDVVFSISVIEHIPGKALPNFWKDHARVLKPGGLALHTIDLYLGDESEEATEGRVKIYLDETAGVGLRPIGATNLARPLSFKCDMATNSDWGMWRWNKNVPALAAVRANHQSVTLWMELVK